MDQKDDKEAVPMTSRGRSIRARVTEEQWGRMVETARQKAQVVAAVEAEWKRDGMTLRQCLAKHAGGMPRTTFKFWAKRAKESEGSAWEALLDGRIPPEPETVPEMVRQGACLLRRVQPGINRAEARKQLMLQFGGAGDVSGSSLHRIWHEAGLTQPPGWTLQREHVEQFSGGGGLAFVHAAAVETGIGLKLAGAVRSAGVVSVAVQGLDFEAPAEPPGRDDRGRLTADYNKAVLAQCGSGVRDPRFDADAAKRNRRALAGLPTLHMRPETLGNKLLCMGVVPLITERRGFDGLDGPAGGWLGVMSPTAYMPATLDKTLAELALLNVGDEMWGVHAAFWKDHCTRWCGEGPGWQRLVIYVDRTQDPYWTRHFAPSGKVSRIGRVQPCLDRVMLMAGPGVPLLVETHSGTTTLKKDNLVSLIEKFEDIVGKGEVGRLTIMDSESATVKQLSALVQMEGRWFISVLKGPAAKGAEVLDPGKWEGYRERDTIRGGRIVLNGDGAPDGGLELRCTEMIRPGSRHPTNTIFITNADKEDLPDVQMVDAYLSRWPRQEQFFRDARNGGGLNRSHGYGGAEIAHVAVETATEKAAQAVARAEKRLQAASSGQHEIGKLATLQTPDIKKAAREARALADQRIRTAEKALKKARDKHEKLKSMPRQIYCRDTTRDNIASVLTLTALMLVEWALKEYFGGLRTEWRTFIEHFVHLPVTVRTSKHRILYQIHENPRQPARMQELRVACAEATQRKIRDGGRLLAFEVIAVPSG